MNFLPQSSVVSLPQSPIVFNPEMFGPSISLSTLQHLQNICDDYAAEHNITFNCNKTFGVRQIGIYNTCSLTSFQLIIL